MGMLNKADRKVVERYLELFAYGKALRSDRQFVDLAIELMSERINSEEGYRKAIDNEKPVKIKIQEVPTLYDLIRQKLQGEQIRKLDEILRSIKREIEDEEFSIYTQPIEALKNRRDPDRQRVLRKHGIEYSLTSQLCSLMR